MEMGSYPESELLSGQRRDSLDKMALIDIPALIKVPGRNSILRHACLLLVMSCKNVFDRPLEQVFNSILQIGLQCRKLEGGIHRTLKKRTIAVCRYGEGASFGCVQRSKETRGNNDCVLFQRALTGADNPTIHHNGVVKEDIAPRVQLFRVRRVKHGAAVCIANNVFVKIR